MAASSTIFNIRRSRTSESHFARMQILARSHEHKNVRRRLEWVILSERVNRQAHLKVLLQLEGEKEGKAQDTRNRSAQVNTPKPSETDLRDPLQHSDTLNDPTNVNILSK